MLTSLSQNLQGDPIRYQLVIDQFSGKIKFGLGGGGKSDFDLFEANVAEELGRAPVSPLPPWEWTKAPDFHPVSPHCTNKGHDQWSDWAIAGRVNQFFPMVGTWLLGSFAYEKNSILLFSSGYEKRKPLGCCFY